MTQKASNVTRKREYDEEKRKNGNKITFWIKFYKPSLKNT